MQVKATSKYLELMKISCFPDDEQKSALQVALFEQFINQARSYLEDDNRFPQQDIWHDAQHSATQKDRSVA